MTSDTATTQPPQSAGWRGKFAGFALNRLPTGRLAEYYYYYYGDKYEKDSVYGSDA